MRFEEKIEIKKEQIVRDTIMSDAFLDQVRKDREPFDRLMACYSCAIMEIETKFKVLDKQFSVLYDQNPIESIKSRIKSMDSLMRKVRKKGIPLNLDSLQENIWDIAGVRVVCSFVDDIYMLADCLLKQDDIRLIEVKDYIKNPKESGYRSLHLIVEVPIFLSDEKKDMKVEVQLRTIAMDFWASLEHRLKYKKQLDPELEAEITKELVSCANESAALDKRMQDVYNKVKLEGWNQEKTPFVSTPVLGLPQFGKKHLI